MVGKKQKRGIISTKPVRRVIYVKMVRIDAQWGALVVWIRKARFCAIVPTQAVGSHVGAIDRLFWVIRPSFFLGWLRRIVRLIASMRFGWVVELNVRGNAYLWRRWVIKKLKREALMVRAGFAYNFLVLLPTTVRMFWHKSFIRLLGVSIGELAAVVEYLRFTRDLFPYKLAGFIFEEERFPLKPGKKRKSNR